MNGPVARKAMNLISPLITRDVTAGGRIFFSKKLCKRWYGELRTAKCLEIDVQCVGLPRQQIQTSLFIEFRRIQLCELSGQTLFTFRKRTSGQVLELQQKKNSLAELY